MEATNRRPPWLSGSYHLRCGEGDLPLAGRVLKQALASGVGANGHSVF